MTICFINTKITRNHRQNFVNSNCLYVNMYVYICVHAMLVFFKFLTVYILSFSLYHLSYWFPLSNIAFTISFIKIFICFCRKFSLCLYFLNHTNDVFSTLSSISPLCLFFIVVRNFVNDSFFYLFYLLYLWYIFSFNEIVYKYVLNKAKI